MKKRIISFVLALSLVFAMSVSAFAASYAFFISPPFVGSLKSTATQIVVSGTAANVNPSTSATPTSYYLSPTPGSSTTATGVLTSISTSGYRGFTYNSGYGGVGNYYCLSGYPSNSDFLTYNVGGTWSP
jgi:hypothetical protein